MRELQDLLLEQNLRNETDIKILLLLHNAVFDTLASVKTFGEFSLLMIDVAVGQ